MIGAGPAAAPWALLCVLGLAACATSPVAVPAPAPVAVALPDSPVGRQLAWVLEVINAKRSPNDAELREHFDERLTEERARVEKVRRLFAQIGAIAPLVPIGLQRGPGSLVASTVGNGGAVRISITVERKTGRISDVSFLPGPPPRS